MADAQDEAQVEEVRTRKELIDQLFLEIGAELDRRHKVTDDICHLSRQITWESKRCISSTLGYFQNPSALNNSERMIRNILKQDKYFTGLAKMICVQDKDRYYRCYTSALQEFVEAFALFTFFKESRLITYEEVAKKLTVEFHVNISGSKEDNDGVKKETIKFQIPITKTDFYFGITDVPGELVRACAAGLHTDKFKEFLFKSCTLVRALHQCLSRVVPFPRGMFEKLSVMRQSLVKLELVCYHVVMKVEKVSLFVMTLKAPSYNVYVHEEEDSGYDI